MQKANEENAGTFCKSKYRNRKGGVADMEGFVVIL